jgi:hypothetical protein
MSNLPISPDPNMDSAQPANEAPPGVDKDLNIQQRILQALRTMAQWVHAETLEGMLVNLKGLPLTHQILTGMGYLAVLGLLALTLLVEVLGPNQPSAHYVTPYSAFAASLPFMANMIGLHLSLPWLALAGVLLAFVLGWAYLLSGATECRRRIFFPILVLFILQLGLISMPINAAELSDEQLVPMIVPCLCMPVLVLFLGIGFGFTAHSPRWQKLTWLKWIGSLALTLVLLLPLMILNPQPASMLFNTAGVLSVPLLVAMLWWFVSGLTGVDLVMRISRFALTGLRRLFPAPWLKSGSIWVTLGHPLASGMLIALYAAVQVSLHPEITGDNLTVGALEISMLLEILLTVPLVLILGGLLVSKHWTERNALALLALNLALPFFSLTVSLALMQGSSLFDIVELATNPLYELAPMLTFVLLMAYSALFLIAEFANNDGQLIPRRARVQLGLGMALLIIAFTLFFSNLRVPAQLDAPGDPTLLFDADNVSTALTAFSLIFLGFPYLLWTLWKDPERMLGDEPTRPAVLSALETPRARPITTVVLAVVALGGLCLCCCASLIFL